MRRQRKKTYEIEHEIQPLLKRKGKKGQLHKAAFKMGRVIRCMYTI
jgi:hypothetical protein